MRTDPAEGRDEALFFDAFGRDMALAAEQAGEGEGEEVDEPEAFLGGNAWCDALFPCFPEREIEMMTYSAAMRWSDCEALIGAGVAARTVARLKANPAAIGRCWAREGKGRWEPAERREAGAAPRLIVAVREHGGVLADMVALSSGEPGRWSLRTGDGVMLGQDVLDRAAVIGGPVRLFSTPWRWLEHGCRGACVLAWGREALSRLRGLGDAVELVVDDARAAEVLGGMLRWGALPRVAAAA